MITDPYARPVLPDEMYEAAVRLRDHPPRPAASHRASARRPHVDADLIEVGCNLLHGDPLNPLAAEEQLYLNDDALIRSGTVYAVVSDADPETGEITRAFLVVKHHKGRLVWDRFRAGEVAKIDPPNPNSMRRLARFCAREICGHRGGKAKRGPFVTADLRCLDALDAFVRALS